MKQENKPAKTISSYFEPSTPKEKKKEKREKMPQVKKKIEKYKWNAKERKIGWHLEDEYAWFLVMCTCAYCGRIPTLKSPNGLDRVKNENAYLITNVVPACGKCNNRKGQKSVAIFGQSPSVTFAQLETQFLEWKQEKKRRVEQLRQMIKISPHLTIVYEGKTRTVYANYVDEHKGILQVSGRGSHPYTYSLDKIKSYWHTLLCENLPLTYFVFEPNKPSLPYLRFPQTPYASKRPAEFPTDPTSS